jgi:hypothetical protein
MPPKTKYIIGLSYSTDTNKGLSLLTDKKAVTHDVFFEVLKISLKCAHAMNGLKTIETEVNKGVALTNKYSDLAVVKSVEASVEKNLEKVIMPTLSKGLTIGNLYFEIKC